MRSESVEQPIIQLSRLELMPRKPLRLYSSHKPTKHQGLREDEGQQESLSSVSFHLQAADTNQDFTLMFTLLVVKCYYINRTSFKNTSCVITGMHSLDFLTVILRSCSGE